MPTSNVLIPVCEGGSWGYVDRNARMVIAPSFTAAGPFRGGLACVNRGGQVGRPGEVTGGKWGYIDASGAYAFSAQFDGAGDFFEGLAAVNLGSRVKYAAHDDFYYSEGGKWGFIDQSGAFVLPPRFQFAHHFREGTASVCESGRYGFIRANGEWAVGANYANASPFHDGLAAVKVGERYGYIDLAGELRIAPRFELAYDFHNGLAAGHTPDPYLWIFFDAEGNERFTAPDGTAHVGHFSDGLIMANLCKLERYSDGRIYPHGLRRGLGYLNDRGEWAIPPQFTWGGSFQEGLAWVKRDEGPCGFIRPDGSFLPTPDLEDANSFDGGLATVRIDGKFALLNLEGKVFWSEQ